MVRPAEAPRRPVEGTPIQFETIRREYSPPVTRARNRLRSQRTRVSTQPVTEVIRNRAVSRQIYHNMHIVRTPNNIEHNSMVLRSHVARMDQQDAMRQTLPTDGTQPRRRAKPRGIFTNVQKRRAQQPQCPVGSFNNRILHPRPSLLNIAQGPQPGPSTVPARDESRDMHAMVTRTQSGGFWRPDLSAHSSSSSLDDADTGTQNTAKRQASRRKCDNMPTSNVRTEVRAQAERRRAMSVQKMDSSASSGSSSKDSEKERSTRLPLERETPSHSSSEQSSEETTNTTSESDIDFSVLHRPSDLSLSELPEHGPVRGKPNTRRWYKSLGKGPRPWSSSSESTDKGKANSEESFRSISTVASNSSYQPNDLNLLLDKTSNHNLPIRNTEENNTAAEENISSVPTECRDTVVGDENNQDLQTRSQSLPLNESNACLHTGNSSTAASSTASGDNNQDKRTSVMNQNTQATDAASFVSSQSMKRKDYDDMRVHDTSKVTKKKKIEIKWKRPPPHYQHLNSHGSDRKMVRQDFQPSISKVPSRTLVELTQKNCSEISSDRTEDKSVDSNIDGDMRKKDAKSRDNVTENNTVKDEDTTDKVNAESRDNKRVNSTAKTGDTSKKEDAKSGVVILKNYTGIDGDKREKENAETRDSIWVNNTANDGDMRNGVNAKSLDKIGVNNTARDGDMMDKDVTEVSDNIWVKSTTKDGDMRGKEDAKSSDNINNTAMNGDKHVMKSKSDEGWVYIIMDNSIGIHTASREKSVGEVIQEMLVQSRMNRPKAGDTKEKDAKRRANILKNDTCIDGVKKEKENAENCDNIWVNNTANEGDMRNGVNAESLDKIRVNNTARVGDMIDKEDAKVSDTIWVNNITKDGDIRVKEDAKNCNSILVNNTAKDGDMRGKEEAENCDNVLVMNTAKDGDMRGKEDAKSSDNINNTAIDGNNHVMKSKSDEGWVYIVMDNSIRIHTASREKSVGEVIQEMLVQSRMNRWANSEARVPSNSFESQSRKRKLDFTITSETKKKKIDFVLKQPQTSSQHLALKTPADERYNDLPSTSTTPRQEQLAKEVEEIINLAPSRTEVAYNTRSAVKRKRGSEKDAGEGREGGGKRRRC